MRCWANFYQWVLFGSHLQSKVLINQQYQLYITACLGHFICFSCFYIIAKRWYKGIFIFHETLKNVFNTQFAEKVRKKLNNFFPAWAACLGGFLFCSAEKGAEKSSPNCWRLLLGCRDCQPMQSVKPIEGFFSCWGMLTCHAIINGYWVYCEFNFWTVKGGYVRAVFLCFWWWYNWPVSFYEGRSRNGALF